MDLTGCPGLSRCDCPGHFLIYQDISDTLKKKVMFMTNEELVSRIQAGIDTAADMAELWQQNRGFIVRIARRFSQLAEEDDLIQEGYIGLSNAVDGYRPGQGGSFLTYASYWIRQAMARYIQNNGIVRIPVNRQTDIWKYQKVRSDFRREYGRGPEIHETAAILGVSHKEVRTLEKDAEWAYISSTETPIGEDELTLGDMLPGCEGIEDDIIDRADREALKAILWPMVDELPGQQPTVIRARFETGLTLRETGEMIGGTLDIARREEKAALRELRRPSRAKKLRPYMEEYIISYAFSGCGVESFNRTWTSSTERAALKFVD